MSARALPAPRARAARRPGTGTVYRWEMRKLSAQKRTYIGLGAALVVPLIFVLALALDGGGGGPDEVAVRALRARDGPGDPARGAALQLGLAVPADHRAGGRRHRRHRGQPRDAQDDPHALHRALARSSPPRRSRRSPTPSLALAVFVATGLVAGGLVWGFDPLIVAVRDADPGRSRDPADRRERARLPHPDARDRRDRPAALDGHAQLRRRGRRHADRSRSILQLLGVISALDSLQPYLLSDAVRRLAGAAARPRGLGARSSTRRGCRRCYGVPAVPRPRSTVFVRRDVAGG